MIWNGVMPAITTAFDEHDQVDADFMEQHCRWLVENGCTGIVALGSLGEGGTLSFEEKLTVLRTCVKALGESAPVIAAISALSTREAVRLAREAAKIGCRGLMVLPPYVYLGDWREMKAHVTAILRATELPCMLYNNPIAYGTDFLPEQICELAEAYPQLEAVKESSADVRRVTAIRLLAGDRLAILAGVDDTIVEAVSAGAVGWVAGLANALPRESVELFDLALRGEMGKAYELYRWFLPLLRMDTKIKFVQLIKLVQAEMGAGYTRVRAPRLELTGAEWEEARKTIQDSLRTAPRISSTPAPLLAR
jgi:dihydrodipicolinate synthase/N-acetylneuraminate lyase